MSNFLRINIPEFLKSGTQIATREQMAQVLASHGTSALSLVDLSRTEFETLLGDSLGAERTKTPAHFTTSCVIFCPHLEKVLLVLHAKYRRWVTPGGHADGDWFWLRSALRECWEETGLTEVDVFPVKTVTPSQKTWSVESQYLIPHFIHRFDIDAFGNVDAHCHFDAVYLLRAFSEEVRFDATESLDIHWFPKETFQRVLAGSALEEELLVGNETASEVLRSFQLIDGL